MKAKKTAFVELFGETPFIKVLDFFLTFSDFDYSKTEVARETNVSRITIERIWRHLIKKSYLIKSRQVGRAELYKLNKQNPEIRLLKQLDLGLASMRADREIEAKAVRQRTMAQPREKNALTSFVKNILY